MWMKLYFYLYFYDLLLCSAAQESNLKHVGNQTVLDFIECIWMKKLIQLSFSDISQNILFYISQKNKENPLVGIRHEGAK